MSGNWSNLQEGLKSGYLLGRESGGKLSGIGQALNKIANDMKEKRLQSEETGRKQNLLGMEGLIKGNISTTKEIGEGTFSVPGIGNVKTVAETPSTWDIQKEARTTVNAMVNQNPILQVQAFKNPSMLTDLIDKEVVRLSNKYKGIQTTQEAVPEIGSQETASKFQPPKVDTGSKRVNVISPDGQKGSIPSSQLQEALKAGYKRTI